jgi:eukaryotic-like serine/threonine-protein kinase
LPDVPDSRRCDVYRFSSFEVKVRAGILLQDGQRIRIQQIPFQILLQLLERSGDLVSREELCARLWSQSSSVESDRSLRVAMAKLRESLRDDPLTPRFIETIPRRGYRFIGEVTPIGIAQQEPAPVESSAKSQAASEEVGASTNIYKAGLPEGSNSDPPHATAVSGQSSHAVHKRIVLSALCLLAAGAVVILFLWGYSLFWGKARPLISSSDKVALGGFTNSSGDPGFDSELFSAFRTKLSESPWLNLVSEQIFRRRLANAESASLSEELHACASLKARVLLRGEILLSAPGYEITGKAWSCATGRPLATVSSHADTPAGVLPALDTVSQNLRRRLGEPENSLQKFNVPLTQATTGSLAALRAFTLGEQKRHRGLELDAITDYKLAVAFDPKFALAYARLGAVYSSAEEYTLERQYYQKAFELRGATTERERLYITANYYSSTGEIGAAVEAYQLWHATYPHDPIAANNLAVQYLILGEPEKAVELARIAVQLAPEMDHAYATQAWAALRTGDYAALSRFCRDSVRTATESADFHLACFQGALARNDAAGMQAEWQWAEKSPMKSEILLSAAWASMYHGAIHKADKLFAEAKQSALANHLPELAAAVDLDQANLDADYGLANQARAAAREALHLFPGSATVQSFAGLALARSGATAEALAAAHNAKTLAPADTILTAAVIGSLQAAIPMQQNQPAAALLDLEAARPFDRCTAMALAPAYYRGLAYLQSRQLGKAAQEFESVLAYRAIMPVSPYIALSQLELGRSLQLQGDRAHAALAYQAVRKTWRGADTDFPPLRQLLSWQNPSAN